MIDDKASAIIVSQAVEALGAVPALLDSISVLLNTSDNSVIRLIIFAEILRLQGDGLDYLWRRHLAPDSIKNFEQLRPLLLREARRYMDERVIIVSELKKNKKE